MSYNNVNSKVKTSYPTKWDEAIADARKRIRSLKSAIAYYRIQKKAGEPWPIESATHN